jgi:hypothetical protein
MKKVQNLGYLLLTSVLISWQPVQAQSLPSPDEVGEIMGESMCEEMITNQGGLVADYAGERLADKLIEKYGEENLDSLLEKMDTDFSGPNLSKDPYLLEVFRNAFLHISNDVDCFKEFVKTF